MWVAGYLLRLPAGLAGDGAANAGWMVPSGVVFGVFAAILMAAGWVAGRTFCGCPHRVWKAGLVAGALNLLVLGSVVGRETSQDLMRVALLWVPASLLATVGVMELGARLGRSRAATAERAMEWQFALVCVVIAATLALLMVGGTVTGFQAGLAVVDWPNSFGYNMFLYPLSKMTGGIYFEHAHRLFGSLVGLCTLILAVHLQMRESRGWVRRLGWVAFVMVCVQGLMGGLRVTGKLTLSQDPSETAPSIALAVAHGAFAQLFLSMLVVLAVISTRRWRELPRATAGQTVSSDFVASALLVGAIFTQIVLGAIFRHYNHTTGLYLHLGFAVVVVLLGCVVAIRAWMLDDGVPVLPAAGDWLLKMIGLQTAMGFFALIAIQWTTSAGKPVAGEVLVTTGHQTMGAILLGSAVMLAMWRGRVVVGAAAAAPEPVTASSRVEAALSTN